MKKLFFILALLASMSISVLATDVTIAASTIANFNPSNLSPDVTLSGVSVTNSSTAVSCSNCLQTNWVGIGGFRIAINGVAYTVAYVTDRSNLTLTSIYLGSTSGAASVVWYKYVELRIFADSSFQPLGKTYVVQPGALDSGSWYKRTAASIVNESGTNNLYIPQIVLDATTDSPSNQAARYLAAFYRPAGSRIQIYDCFDLFALPPNGSMSWPDICNYNRAASPVFDYSAYSRTQIDARFPGCTSGQMLYFAATGQKLDCLSLDPATLQINAGIISVIGGGGGSPLTVKEVDGSPTVANVQTIRVSNGTLTNDGGNQVTISTGGGSSSDDVMRVQNVKEGYSCVGNGVANDTTCLTNAIAAANSSTTKKVVYLPEGSYLITTGLSVPAGVTIRGSGANSVITTASTIDVLTATGIGVTFENFKITGGRRGIVISSGQSWPMIRGVTFTGITAHTSAIPTAAVYFAGLNTDAIVKDSIFTANGNLSATDDGADIFIAASAGSARINVLNNTITGGFSRFSAVAFDTDDFVFTGNYVDQNNQIAASSPSDISGYGVVSYASVNTGVVKRTRIANNTIVNSAGSGAYLVNSFSATIVGNTFRDTAKQQLDTSLPVGAIALNGGNGATVTGNVIEKTTTGNGIALTDNYSTTTLNGAITNLSGSMSFASTLLFGDAGDTVTFSIDSELIYCRILSSTALVSCVRGVYNTNPASHSNGATVTARGPAGITIGNNTIREVAGNAGIHFRNTCDGCVVESNTISNGTTGILSTSGIILRNARIIGNTIDQVTGQGINLLSTQDVTIDSNRVLIPSAQGILIQAGARATITNNTVTGAGAAGIDVRSSTGLICGNHVTLSSTGVDDSGQSNYYCDSNRISGNTTETNFAAGRTSQLIDITSGTTPPIAGSKYFRLNYASPTTITNFVGGDQIHNTIVLLAANGNATIQGGGAIGLNGNNNFVMATGDMLVLHWNGGWYEQSRQSGTNPLKSDRFYAGTSTYGADFESVKSTAVQAILQSTTSTSFEAFRLKDASTGLSMDLLNSAFASNVLAGAATGPSGNFYTNGAIGLNFGTNGVLRESWSSAGLWTVILGSDATGDLYRRNSSGNIERLPIGSAGQCLTVSAGLPAWGSCSGGGGSVSGSGAAGQATFWTSSSGVSGDSAFLWDNTAKALGLGASAHASALLGMTSTTKGFLPPRMNVAQRDAISSPAEGLMIENTDFGQANLFVAGNGSNRWQGVLTDNPYVFNADIANGDDNFKPFAYWQLGADATLLDVGFATQAGLAIDLTTTNGVNFGDASAKTTSYVLGTTLNARGQGQKLIRSATANCWGMGDCIGEDMTLNISSGISASGDEGQFFHRYYLTQPSSVAGGTVSSVTTPATINTTITATVTGSKTAQAVSVASVAGVSVGQWVVVGQSLPAGSTWNEIEAVKVTAVGASTITGVFRHNHAIGVTIKPATVLVLSGCNNCGQGRYLVNLTTTPYTTGTAAGLSGSTITGVGTTWSTSMVGGNALNIGVISFSADDYSGSPYASDPLETYYPIMSLTDATHLNIYRLTAIGLGNYNGNQSTQAAYTIRPGARVLAFDPTTSINASTVVLENNTFAWAPGDSVENAFSSSADVEGEIYRFKWYSPGQELRSMIDLQNIGPQPFEAGLTIHNTAGFVAARTGVVIQQVGTGVSIDATGDGIVFNSDSLIHYNNGYYSGYDGTLHYLMKKSATVNLYETQDPDASGFANNNIIKNEGLSLWLTNDNNAREPRLRIDGRGDNDWYVQTTGFSGGDGRVLQFYNYDSGSGAGTGLGPVVALKASGGILLYPTATATSGANKASQPVLLQTSVWDGSTNQNKDWKMFVEPLSNATNALTEFAIQSPTSTYNLLLETTGKLWIGTEGAPATTRWAKFDPTSITAAATRTYTLPDVDGKMALTTGSLTTNNCAKFDSSGRLVDAGATCGSGGVTWDTVGDPLANVTHSMSSFNTVFNFTTGTWTMAWSGNTSTGVVVPISHSNTTATGDLVKISTSASVSVKPFRVTPRGNDSFLADHLGNVVHGNAALSTSATDGFFYLTSSAGVPAGTPATTYTGRVPIEIDTTNSRLYGYFGGAWVNLSSGGGGSPGGSNTQIQYNNAGAFGGVSGLTTNGSTTLVQTSNSATAFESGPNGSTNPVFRLVNNVSSAATGLSITGNAAGSGVTLTAISSGTNEGITIAPKALGFNTSSKGGVDIAWTSSMTRAALTVTTGTENFGLFAGGSQIFFGAISNHSLSFFTNNGSDSLTISAAGTTVSVQSGSQLAWSSTTSASGAVDTGFARSAAGWISPTNGSTGAGGFDIKTQAAPGSPAAGAIRVYADSGTGKLACKDSGGADCMPAGSGSPGGASGTVQFNNTGSFGGVTGSSVSGGQIALADVFTTSIDNATTNAVSTIANFAHSTSGTPANGLGAGIALNLESSTTVGRNAGQINAIWSDVTDASRTSYLAFNVLSNAVVSTGLIVQGAGSSPVNYFQISTANTANGPEFATVGADTNIDLLLVAKGSGIVKADGVEVATVSGTQTIGSKTFSNTNSFSGFFDVTRISVPSNPASGSLRLFANNTTGKLACLDNAGADCMPSGSGSPAGSTGDYQINNGGSFGAGVLVQGSTGRLTATPTLASSGVAPYLRIVTPADTGQTADTEFPGIFLGGNSSGATVIRTGADGTTYLLQREIIAPTVTYAYAGATTVALALGSDWYSPTAGSNATFTAAAAARFNASAAGHVALVANSAASPTTNIFETHINGVATTGFRVTKDGLPSSIKSGYSNGEFFGGGQTYTPTTGGNETIIGQGISITGTGDFSYNTTIGRGITQVGTSNSYQGVFIGGNQALGNGGNAYNLSVLIGYGTRIAFTASSGKASYQSVGIGASGTLQAFQSVGIGAAFNLDGSSLANVTGVGYNFTISADSSSGLGSGGNIASSAAVGLGRDVSIPSGNNNSLVAGSSSYPTNNWYGGKGITNATPTAYTINGTGCSGSNCAGAVLNLAGGKGTGTGVGGTVVVQVAPAGSSGSSLNSLVDVATFDATASNTRTVAVGSGTGASVKIGEVSGFRGIWLDQSSPSTSNYAFLYSGGTLINTPSGTTLSFRVNNANVITQSSTLTSLLTTVLTSPSSTTAAPTLFNVGNVNTEGAQTTYRYSASLTDGTALAGYYFGGSLNGTSVQNGGSINLEAAGTWASSDAPGRLIFKTTPVGSATLVTRLTIDASQNSYFGNGITAASPVAHTANATGCSGANCAGASLNLFAGKGTGTGASGSLGFQFARPGSSGSSLNTLSDSVNFSYSTDTISQLWKLKTSTTAETDATQIAGTWITNTHASRTSALLFSTVNNAGSLSNVFSIEAGQYYGTRSTQSGSSAQTINWNSGNVQEQTFTGNITFTFSNGKAGAIYVLTCIQDATGSRTVTWPASAKWPGGTPASLTAAGNSKDSFIFYFDGTNYLNIGQAYQIQ